MLKHVYTTGPMKLNLGDLVLNKTQQSKIKRARKPETIHKVIKKVMKQNPK